MAEEKKSAPTSASPERQRTFDFTAEEVDELLENQDISIEDWAALRRMVQYDTDFFDVVKLFGASLVKDYITNVLDLTWNATNKTVTELRRGEVKGAVQGLRALGTYFSLSIGAIELAGNRVQETLIAMGVDPITARRWGFAAELAGGFNKLAVQSNKVLAARVVKSMSKKQLTTGKKVVEIILGEKAPKLQSRVIEDIVAKSGIDPRTGKPLVVRPEVKAALEASTPPNPSQIGKLTPDGEAMLKALEKRGIDISKSRRVEGESLDEIVRNEFTAQQGKDPSIAEGLSISGKTPQAAKLDIQTAKIFGDMTKEEVLERAAKGIASAKAAVEKAQARVPREEIAARVAAGIEKELPVTPERVRKMVVDSLAPELTAEFEAMVARGVTDGDFMEFFMKFAALAENELPRFMGTKASAGRTIGEFRDPTTSFTEAMNTFASWMAEITANPVTAKNLMSYRDVIVTEFSQLLTDSHKTAQFLGQASSGTAEGVRHGLRALLYANIFSSPLTPFRNIMGGASVMAANLMKQPLAAKKLIKSQLEGAAAKGPEAAAEALENPAAFPIMETTARFFGMGQGALESFKAIKRGEAIKLAGGMAKFETIQRPGWWSYGTNLLIIGDAFIRGMNTRGELLATATREALKAGKKAGTKAFDEFIEGFITVPPRSVINRAAFASDEAAARLSMGPVAKKVTLLRDALDRIPGSPLPIGTLAQPVIRAGASLGRSVWNWSPMLSRFSKRTFDALDSGDPVQIADTMARINMADALGYAALTLAASGIVTGSGPGDADMRAKWQRLGWQPSRLNIGDKSIDLRNFPPFGPILVAVADLFDMYSTGNFEEASFEKAFNGVLNLGLGLLSNTTYLTDLGDMLSNIENPDSPTWTRAASEVLQKLTPYSALIKWFESVNDPEARIASEEVMGIMETYRQRMGFGTKVKRDFFGNKVMTPAFFYEQPDDPRQQELNNMLRDLNPAMDPVGNVVMGQDISRRFGAQVNPEKIPFRLSDEEWDVREVATGHFFQRFLEEEILTDPDFAAAKPPMKRFMIEQAWQSAREAGIGTVFEQFTDLETEVESHFSVRERIMEGEATEAELGQAIESRRLIER